jgi:hypothetical protein
MRVIGLQYPEMGRRWLAGEGKPEMLFTENETNYKRLFGVESPSPYVKDAFHEYLVHASQEAVNPANKGTKAAALYRLNIPAGKSATLRLRLTDTDPAPGATSQRFWSSPDASRRVTRLTKRWTT